MLEGQGYSQAGLHSCPGDPSYPKYKPSALVSLFLTGRLCLFCSCRLFKSLYQELPPEGTPEDSHR